MLFSVLRYSKFIQSKLVRCSVFTVSTLLFNINSDHTSPMFHTPSVLRLSKLLQTQLVQCVLYFQLCNIKKKIFRRNQSNAFWSLCSAIFNFFQGKLIQCALFSPLSDTQKNLSSNFNEQYSLCFRRYSK